MRSTAPPIRPRLVGRPSPGCVRVRGRHRPGAAAAAAAAYGPLQPQPQPQPVELVRGAPKPSCENLLCFPSALLGLDDPGDDYGETTTYDVFRRRLTRGELARVDVIDGGRQLVFTPKAAAAARGASPKQQQQQQQQPQAQAARVALPRGFVSPEFFDDLARHGVVVSYHEASTMTASLMMSASSVLSAAALAWVIVRRGGGGGGFLDMTRSLHRFDRAPAAEMTFADVAGVDAAKREVAEVVEFLRHPGKFAAVGARMPRGCLLIGAPGTGKTLLARSIAGEAGVPFFSCSGSSFVQMFVGVGAGRVRDLFARAKAHAPCVVFIDEIDAIGRSRGPISGSNEEREQTINQLLVEMDGFDGDSGIVVVAATNRADVLDAALLRPGRFDRQVLVDLPDLAGRAAILRVHAHGKPVASYVDTLRAVARMTPRFSGADLSNLVNEAAIRAARGDRKEVLLSDFEGAYDRIVLGVERPAAGLSPESRRVAAVHEAGHALVGLRVGYARLRKVTIEPRGRMGGVAVFEPDEAGELPTRAALEAALAVALGGRAAEELLFGAEGVTTGASGDLANATAIARSMVAQYGFGSAVAVAATAAAEPWEASESTLDVRDADVRALVARAHLRASQVVAKDAGALRRIADALVLRETLSGAEVAVLLTTFSLGGAGGAGPPADPEQKLDQNRQG